MTRVGPEDGSHGVFADRANAIEEADALIARAASARRGLLGRPLLLGVSGAQGSGKSTAAARLTARFESQGLRAAALSIDDFYLTRTERRALGRAVHPLLETRGVPGTHDVTLAHATLDALLGSTGSAAAPVFDKSLDDRAPEHRWPEHRTPLDILILEGWCVGARRMPEDALGEPVNALEADEDADGRWRRHVDEALRGPYRDLFERIDLLVLLRAPGFEQVHAWRTEQEAALVRSLQAPPAMDASEIARFIAHYERLTRWVLADEPADLVIDIDADRVPLRWRPGRRGHPIQLRVRER